MKSSKIYILTVLIKCAHTHHTFKRRNNFNKYIHQNVVPKSRYAYIVLKCNFITILYHFNTNLSVCFCKMVLLLELARGFVAIKDHISGESKVSMWLLETSPSISLEQQNNWTCFFSVMYDANQLRCTINSDLCWVVCYFFCYSFHLDSRVQCTGHRHTHTHAVHFVFFVTFSQHFSMSILLSYITLSDFFSSISHFKFTGRCLILIDALY